MKCSGENVILREIVHVVSGFPLHFMLYRGNLDCFSKRDVTIMSRIHRSLLLLWFIKAWPLWEGLNRDSSLWVWMRICFIILSIDEQKIDHYELAWIEDWPLYKDKKQSWACDNYLATTTTLQCVTASVSRKNTKNVKASMSKWSRHNHSWAQLT